MSRVVFCGLGCGDGGGGKIKSNSNLHITQEHTASTYELIWLGKVDFVASFFSSPVVVSTVAMAHGRRRKSNRNQFSARLKNIQEVCVCAAANGQDVLYLNLFKFSFRRQHMALFFWYAETHIDWNIFLIIACKHRIHTINCAVLCLYARAVQRTKHRDYGEVKTKITD